MIKIVGGMGGSGSIGDWWDVSSATPLAAWQAKGAASAAAAKLDLTGNGYDLTGADPTWSVSDGFTSYVEFDALSLTLPYSLTAIWFGELFWDGTSSSSTAFSTAGNDWTGLRIQTHSDFKVRGGYNSSSLYYHVGIRVASGESIFLYWKDSTDNSQKLFQNNTQITGTTPSGSTPIDRSTRVRTGVTMKAAALYSGVLSSADISAITTALNNL